MLQSLKNIQSSFKMMKTILIVVVVASLSVVGVCVYQCFKFAELQRQKIYVLDQDKALILAIAQDVYQNRVAEARSHVRRFHDFFFSLSPSKEAIEYNISTALKLADNTAVKQYEKLLEQNFYNAIIESSMSVEIQMDSINIDINSYPYKVWYYGKIAVVRTSSVNYKSLKTEGELRNCTRTDDNPHGFILERWKITEFEDIKQINR